MPSNRLQGTDGIRGPVCFAESTHSNNPISAFLNEGVLTEEFFELYTYAYCMELLDNNFANEFDMAVIGCDPRDSSGLFYESAVRGIRKAGLKATKVDILPTPAISLYQLYIGAACGFVLTASHNSADQNGIKIFLGHSNLKLFPEDDKRLTRRCLQINYEELKKAELIGESCNEHLSAKNLFINFLADSRNNWISDDTLNGSTIIFDCANGAFSPLINELNQLGSADYIFTNHNPAKGINLKSGVADLEGLDYIFSDDLEKGVFSGYDSISNIFKIGREQRITLMSSSKLVLGFIFDGDGDRCFILIYDPYLDCILVLGGDVLAFFQAKYLRLNYDSSCKQLFVNTIESDLEAGRAAEKIGYNTMNCAVGDKWILWQAYFHLWEFKLEYYLQKIDENDFKKLVKQVKSEIEIMIHSSQLDALYATSKYATIEKWITKNKGADLLPRASKYACIRSNNSFAIGSEESGHLITLANLISLGGYEIPVFIGNSLRCAFNSVAAIQKIRNSKNTPDLFKWIKDPFPKGYKKSLQVYYVDKSLLEEKSSVRQELVELLLSNIDWPGIETKLEKCYEELDMLILRAYEDGFCVASVFVRNSGTEDKMALYLRGVEKFTSHLDELARRIFPFLLASFKNKNSIMANAERLVLNCLRSGPKRTMELRDLTQVSIERLLHEMCVRQNLICKDGNDWRITKTGINLLSFSERSE